MLDGEIYRGPTGMGAELGHMIVDPLGPRCGCGKHGCLEAVASGSALSRMGREAAAADPDGLIARIGRAEGVVTGHTVTAAAQQDDPTALDIFTRLGRWLGIGIASLATIFELEAVVIGGGVIRTGDLLLAPTRAAAREYAYAPQARGVPPVLPATFGSEAGMIGAALLALEHADRKPGGPRGRRSLGVSGCPWSSGRSCATSATTTAAVWVQLDRAATVTVLGCSARTFEVAGHHYALVAVTGLEPDTTYPYEVAVDGDVVWPPPVSPFPPSTLRTRGPASARRQRIVFGSCRYAKVPSTAEARDPAGHRRARRLRRADGAAAAGGVARRAAAARRPGLRRRADAAEPPPHRRAPRPAPGLAGRRDRRLRRVRRPLPRLVERPRGALAAVVRPDAR